MDMYVEKLIAENVLLEGVVVQNGILPFPNTPSLVVPNHSGLPMFAPERRGEVVVQDLGEASNLSPTLWQFQLVRDNVYYIYSNRNGGVLQPLGKSTERDISIITADFDGDEFQQWEFIRISPQPGSAPVDIYNIRNVGSGMYLDVFADNLQRKERFIQFPLVSVNIYNQRFCIVPFGPPFR